MVTGLFTVTLSLGLWHIFFMLGPLMLLCYQVKPCCFCYFVIRRVVLGINILDPTLLLRGCIESYQIVNNTGVSSHWLQSIEFYRSKVSRHCSVGYLRSELPQSPSPTFHQLMVTRSHLPNSPHPLLPTPIPSISSHWCL